MSTDVVKHNKKVEAVISAIHGRHPRQYVVAYPLLDEDCDFIGEGKSITFSLSVWQGKNKPWLGQNVHLSKLIKSERGWRAMKASPVSSRKKERSKN